MAILMVGCDQSLEPGVTLEGDIVYIRRSADGPIVTGTSESTVASIFDLYNSRVGRDASQQIVQVKHRRGSTYIVTPAQQLSFNAYRGLGPLRYIIDLDLSTVECAPRE
jgi:hypothetical protein